VLGAYRLDPTAEPAVECLATMENLCRVLHSSFKSSGEDKKRGLPEVEKLITEAHGLLWAEIIKRWHIGSADTANVTPEPEPVSIGQATTVPTDPFNW